MTFPKVQSRSSSLTWRISGEPAVLPGQHHTRTGIPSRVTAIPTTTWGGRRGSPWTSRDCGTPPGRSRPPAAYRCCRRAVGVGLDDPAVVIAPERLVGVLGLEVGAGGVEEDQIHFEVQQVRDRVEHPARERV